MKIGENIHTIVPLSRQIYCDEIASIGVKSYKYYPLPLFKQKLFKLSSGIQINKI